MHKPDRETVVFHSKGDLAAGYYLPKAEVTLKKKLREPPTEINVVLELYNIKLYIDNETYLKNLSQSDIEIFKQKVIQYGEFIGIRTYGDVFK
jgi:hypothetical protein